MFKLGIMGGTFNPVHIGHLIAAQEVADKMGLDKIIFMPTGNPPHKQNGEVLPVIHRYEMVKLAIENNQNFEISDYEAKRSGKTYTYDTLLGLKSTYDSVQIYFIVGFDTLKEMDSWKRVQDVFKMCSFVVVNRGNLLVEMQKEIDDKKLKYGGAIEVVNIPDINISSTELRERIKLNKSVKYLMPDNVISYIYDNKLYTDMER